MGTDRIWSPPTWDRRQSVKGRDHRGPSGKGLLDRRGNVWDRRNPVRWLALAAEQDEALAVARWRREGCKYPLNTYRTIFNHVGTAGAAAEPPAPPSLDIQGDEMKPTAESGH